MTQQLFPLHRLSEFFEFNLTTSMVKLGERWYPAVIVECPPHPEQRDWLSPQDRSLIGLTFHIPLENGALVQLSVRAPDTQRIHVTIDHHRCIEDGGSTVDGPLWIPQSVGVVGGKLVPDCYTEHVDPEWEWFGEWIDRISRMELPSIHGPKVRLVPIGEMPRLEEGLHEQIREHRAAKGMT